MPRTELWTTAKVAELLGYTHHDSAQRALTRARIRPVGREPGRTGMNLYRASEVRAAFPDRFTPDT